MEARTDTLTSLAELSIGTQATVLAFSEEVCKKTKRRLEDLGLPCKSPNSMLSHLPFGDPISMAVDGLVLAIENDVAQQIIVSEQ